MHSVVESAAEVNERMAMRDGIPDKMRAKLKELSRQFVHGLPERIGGLHAALYKLEMPDEWNLDDFEEAKNAAHKLSGSGATFGFASISNIAREIELLLDSRMEQGGPLTDTEKANIDELYKSLAGECEHAQIDTAVDLDRTTQVSPRGGHPHGEADGDEGPRHLCLWKSDSFYIEDLKIQLGFFGFSILEAESILDVKKLLEDDKTVVLIVDACLMRRDAGLADAFREFCAEGKKDKLKIMFLCEQDDFDIRLFAVRHGGDAFFGFPFDISRLIDTIDDLSNAKEQEPFHVLIVDDDPEQISFYAMILQKAGMITSVVSDPRNVIRVLIEFKPELILMDLYMPGCGGPELAALIRQQEAFVGIPIVFLSVERDVNKQLDAIKQGGDDFLTKPIQPDHLITSVAIRVERTRKIRYFMERDSLTGLLNHSQLKKKLSDDINRARRLGSPICFAMIDIDHFKSVNDNYGHLTGDRVLKSLAKLLQERLRKTDTIGRYGGEEFGVILFNTDLANGVRLMNEIRETFSQIRQRENKQDFFVTFSCGITAFRPDADMGIVSEEADRALYAAKNNGRNRVESALPV